jgi:hypothetical protein
MATRPDWDGRSLSVQPDIPASLNHDKIALGAKTYSH